MPPCVDPGKNDQAQDAAVACHTTIPDAENAERILGQVVQEPDVAGKAVDPPAQRLNRRQIR